MIGARTVVADFYRANAGVNVLDKISGFANEIKAATVRSMSQISMIILPTSDHIVLSHKAELGFRLQMSCKCLMMMIQIMFLTGIL